MYKVSSQKLEQLQKRATDNYGQHVIVIARSGELKTKTTVIQ
jgi:hypothetical protein